MPFAPVNGTKLHYHVTGDGMPIVFIHPPLLNMQNFNYQRAQLSDFFKVVTFDIRGHGHSPYSKEKISYSMIAEDMKQLLDFLDIKEAVLCGYSTGGGIALEAMLMYPERFVGGILLSAMSEVSDLYNRGRIRLASGLSRIKAKRLLSGAIGWGNADMSKTFENLYKGSVHGDIRNIQQYYDCSLHFNCTDRLSAIKQPVLLLYGKNDVSFHRYAKILNERLPVRDLIFIENVGHQIPTKAPRTMTRLVHEWMERHFAGTLPESRAENYLQDIPDFLPDADTPTAMSGQQEL